LLMLWFYRKRDAFFAALFLLHLVVVVSISLFASTAAFIQRK